MAETFHGDVNGHLIGIRNDAHAVADVAQEGLVTLKQLQDLDADLTAGAKRTRVDVIKAACGHDPCPIADNYQGNPAPPAPAAPPEAAPLEPDPTPAAAP